MWRSLCRGFKRAGEPDGHFLKLFSSANDADTPTTRNLLIPIQQPPRYIPPETTKASTNYFHERAIAHVILVLVIWRRRNETKRNGEDTLPWPI